MSEADRLKAALRVLRWSFVDLAAMTGKSRATARRWSIGLYPVPGDVLAWIEALRDAHENNPPPNSYSP